MHRLILMSLLALAAPALADETPQRMVTEAEAPLWNGVARLNIAGNRFCNAVLISDREAVTVAHCLFHDLTLHQANLGDLKLVFGLRRSDYVALRGVAAVAVLPGFTREVGHAAAMSEVENDLALLRLDAPAPVDTVLPLPVEAWLGGDLVTITGYGRDRPYLPSQRQDCPILWRTDKVAELGCTIVPGLSGAAVTGPAAPGQPAPLFALVSASQDSDVGHAVVIRVGPRLQELRDLLPTAE